MRAKTPSESCATATHIVLPDDTNTLGNLMGGRLMYWMDVISAVAAHRHCGRVVVTAAVNSISFNQPIGLGDFVTLEANVSRAFDSSMEVFIEVWVENHKTTEKIKCNEAIFTFVAVDQVGNTIDVPALTPESAIEKERFDGALRRRQLSLILAGRMKPKDATELKAIFEDLA
ncbi:MAG: acyl-CoA thioesterase [Cryomorphaceae bacterium]